jgi:hypothetical protein
MDNHRKELLPKQSGDTLAYTNDIGVFFKPTIGGLECYADSDLADSW